MSKVLNKTERITNQGQGVYAMCAATIIFSIYTNVFVQRIQVKFYVF